MAKQFMVKAPLVIAKQEDGSVLYLYAGSPVPSSVTGDEMKRLVADGFLVESKEASSEAEQSTDPYAGWKVEQLKAEVDKRNESREDAYKIVPVEPGNKPEVLAALHADDEKSKQ